MYFLAHTRLAPVQIAWFGHPDTSGIPNVDMFVSTEFEVDGAEAHYSERLIRMSGLGAYFPWMDTSDLPEVDELRASVREELHLADSTKFYLCAQALYKFHPMFDDALLAILERDKDAHLLILDDLDRTVWQTHVSFPSTSCNVTNSHIPHPERCEQLVQRLQHRMAGKVKGRAHDLLQRVLFYTVSGERVCDDDVIRFACCSVFSDVARCSSRLVVAGNAESHQGKPCSAGAVPGWWFLPIAHGAGAWSSSRDLAVRSPRWPDHVCAVPDDWLWRRWRGWAGSLSYKPVCQ